MEDLLISTLKKFGFPVRLQGSFQEDEQYPDTFFTYWNNDSYDVSHFSNVITARVYDYDVRLYSRDTEVVYTKLREAVERLRDFGFIISGDGYSIATDDPDFDAREVNVLYRQTFV